MTITDRIKEVSKYDVGGELCRPETVEQAEYVRGYNEGMRHEHARLTPLINSLCNVVSVAEHVENVLITHVKEKSGISIVLASLTAVIDVMEEL